MLARGIVFHGLSKEENTVPGRYALGLSREEKKEIPYRSIRDLLIFPVHIRGDVVTKDFVNIIKLWKYLVEFFFLEERVFYPPY